MNYKLDDDRLSNVRVELKNFDKLCIDFEAREVSLNLMSIQCKTIGAERLKNDV